ncbi:MAG: hypothetical protein JXR10_08045 [Cyclobacteriaceae bacterium]
MSVFSELFRYFRISLRVGLKDSSKVSNSNIYVSLTTTPDRIGKIKDTLNSLLDQNTQAQAIILNLPRVSLKGVEYSIPSFLKNNTNVTINWIPEDLGPASKSLPTLRNPDIPSDALIVVLDDDQVYPKNLLELYLQSSQLYPDHALTICGWKVPKSLQHQEKKILRGAGLKLAEPKANISEDSQVEVLQGASSYAIKKSFFDNQIFDFSVAPINAMFADDIWLSGHLAKRKVPRKLIKGSFSYCRILAYPHFKTEGLRDTANADNSNNDALYRYFENDWQLFD